jgi:hypothetical protein
MVIPVTQRRFGTRAWCGKRSPAEAASIYERLQGQRIGASRPKWEVAEVKLTHPARSE